MRPGSEVWTVFLSSVLGKEGSRRLHSSSYTFTINAYPDFTPTIHIEWIAAVPRSGPKTARTAYTAQFLDCNFARSSSSTVSRQKGFSRVQTRVPIVGFCSDSLPEKSTETGQKFRCQNLYATSCLSLSTSSKTIGINNNFFIFLQRN